MCALFAAARSPCRGVVCHTYFMPAFVPPVARTLWQAFLTNATDLVDDARLLAEHEAYARSRALLITAWCEIGRAMALTAIFNHAWQTGSTKPLIVKDEALRDDAALARYCRDFVLGDVLERYWGVTPPHRSTGTFPNPQRDSAAVNEALEALNARRWATKVTVDVSAKGVRIPAQIFTADTTDDIRRTAEAIALILLTDHKSQADNGHGSAAGSPLGVPRPQE